MNDSEAIHLLKQGDISGLDLLVERYQVKALRTAYLITQDRGLAEDVIQSAFIRVYDRIEQFDIRYPFEPWFMRIVINIALKVAGSQKTISRLDLNHIEILPDYSPGPEQTVLADEQEQIVRQALKELSPGQRAVMIMRYYLGYTEGDMARELQKPLGTIRWRLYAAHQRLRGLLRGIDLKKQMGVASDE